MLTIKKALFVLLLFSTVLSCRSQSKIDAILLKPADSLNATDIPILIKSGYFPNVDAPIIGTYMVSITNNNHVDKWTVKQLLDSVKMRIKKQMTLLQ